MIPTTKTLADLDRRPRPVLNDITVVIPTLGRDILQECLYWIASGSARPAQIIVVDQGKREQVAHWLNVLSNEGLATLYIPSSEKGASAGRNRGLEQVNTRFVALTDDDCFVGTNWLENVEASLKKDPHAAVTGRVETVDNNEVIMVVTSRTPTVSHRPGLKFDTLSTGNMGASMDVFERVGLFDENLLTSEDGEWAYRALRAGVPIVYDPEIMVKHVGWRTESGRYDQYREYAHGHGGFYGKYLRKGDWFIALRVLIHFLRSIKRLIRGVLTRDSERMLSGWAYLTGLLPGIIRGMRRV